MTGENIILLIAVNANLQLRYDAKVLDMTLKTLDGDQIVYKEAKVSEYFGFNRPIELDIFRNAICYDKIKELESNLGRNADSSTEGSARRQQKCRSENISTQKRAFFNAHKDEEWLKNKYHPTNLLRIFERRNRQAQETAKKFLLYLSKGILDLSPCATAFYSSKPWQNSEPNSYDKAGEKNRRLNKGQDEESEFLAALKAHPVSCLRRRIQSGM
nr:serrate RNA effector molecule-like isoform X2 [Ziziphus jujuba var. spinosa]